LVAAALCGGLHRVLVPQKVLGHGPERVHRKGPQGRGSGSACHCAQVPHH
jgi:hypothetical protein